MKKVIFVIFFALILPFYLFATSSSVIVVESEGESYMSEIDTPKEVMERAKRDAEYKAIEKAVGVFIKSSTVVYNSQLEEDLLYASVRGKIEKSKVIEERWDSENRNLYRVKIKAYVSPIYQGKGSGIEITANLNKKTLKHGEKVKLFFQSNRDCHIYIFSIASDGSVTLLFPNALSKNNFIKGNTPYEFPFADSKFDLKAMLLPDFTGDYAEEKIKILATMKKEEIITLGFKEGLFQVYDAKSTGMISELLRKLSLLEPSEWTELTIRYKIER